MRDLELNELQFVSGAGCSPTPPSGDGCSPCPPSEDHGKNKKPKGNNGFGNGGNDGSNAGFQDSTR